jgi:hypothetical protein
LADLFSDDKLDLLVDEGREVHGSDPQEFQICEVVDVWVNQLQPAMQSISLRAGPSRVTLSGRW